MPRPIRSPLRYQAARSGERRSLPARAACYEDNHAFATDRLVLAFATARRDFIFGSPVPGATAGVDGVTVGWGDSRT
jgi:hypothetical protein